MKKLLSILLVIVVLCSCSKTDTVHEVVVDDHQLDVNASYTVDSLAMCANTLVDSMILIRGIVEHTCVRSGKRCYITNADKSQSIRIDAKGGIGGFNKELIGSGIVVRGIVREVRWTYEYVSNLESELAENAQKDNNEKCDTGLAEVVKMKRWMEDNGKDYYSTYTIEGIDYELIN